MREAGETPQKKVKTETVEPTTPQPLTAKNLKLLQGIVMPPTEKDSHSAKSASTETKASITSRGLLEANAIVMFDLQAFGKYPQILNMAQNIISNDRKSVMSPEEIGDIKDAQPLMAMVNEDSFIDELWWRLLRPVRLVKGSSGDNENAEDWALTKWSASHLLHIRNLAFKNDMIPNLNPGDDEDIKKLLKSLPKIANPQPDLCYGLTKKAFTDEEHVTNETYRRFTNLTSIIYHSFCVIEFKTEDGKWSECKTQCCRGGAALVHAIRSFKALSDSDTNDVLKTDHLESNPCIAFSLAVEPELVNLHVHWAERTLTNKTIYHMNDVREYVLKRDDELKYLRHDLNNILDWGLFDRKSAIKDIIANIKKPQGVKRPHPKDGEDSVGGDSNAGS